MAMNLRHQRRPIRRLRFQRLGRRELLAADLIISEFLASNSSTLQDGNGDFSDWIELRNAGASPVDLSGWSLTDDALNLRQWSFPSSGAPILAPGDFLVVFASGNSVADPAGNLHTNFSLSASGDYVALVRPDLVIASEFGAGQTEYPPQRSDVSYGIDPNAAVGAAPSYFLTPTPGAANVNAVAGFVADTTFSIDRGYYDEAFTVQIASPTIDATLVYTTDGSEPTVQNGIKVTPALGQSPTANVPVSTTTTLRAAAFKTGFQATDVDTQTYLFLDAVAAQPNLPSGYPNVWGSAPAADYEMDPEITGDPAYTQDLLDGLRELPALSLVTDIEGLFGAQGIYANPLDDSLEVPVSAEYLLPDGSSGFQIDAGLKIAGGASRNPNNSPKHSMSLRFRSIYGASKLEYDLFDGSPVNQFNSLQLRAVYNNSWIHWDQGQRSRGTLIRDQFIRDSLIAAGHDDAGFGHYSHVYLNGLYWGVYNLHERADASHFAAHNGGDAQDYDALNGGVAIDGTITSWEHVQSVVASKDWSAIGQVLDVDNFIDWTLAQAYGGNADLKLNGNWRAAGGGTAAAPWRMYAWDSERILEGITDKPPATITDATGLFGDLIQVPEFVVRLGDRIQKHFTGDGAFTPQASLSRWNTRAAELQKAIVAESARWGDYRRDVHPRGATPLLYRRDQVWAPEVSRVATEYFPQRTPFLIDQFLTLGWLPSIGAPAFLIDGGLSSGGAVAAGSRLGMTTQSGIIYFTADGSDPRSEGGAAAPSAIAFDPTPVSTPLIAAGDVWRYHDRGTDLGTAWRSPMFDDSAWSFGPAELGFGDGDEATVVSFGDDQNNKHRTTYFRKTFDVTSTDLTALRLRLRRDDGAVAYLNGVEIARDNVPEGAIEYSTSALRAAPDDGNTWIDFAIPIDLIRNGSNAIAVEIHQNSPTSSDLSFDAELIADSQTSPSIVLIESVMIRARTRDSQGNWSAVQDALFLVPNTPASADNLRITEINYNPAVDPNAEYLEFRNITSGPDGVTVDLDGVTLTDGPSTPYVIPINTKLAPGQSAVIVHDIAAFTAAYPDVDRDRIIGQYAGKLSNSGERIRVLDRSGQVIADLTYGSGDPWPKWADGLGGSLVLKHPQTTPASELGKPYRYVGSSELGGSPAASEQVPYGVIINEVLAHTDEPLSDSIEIYNPTNTAVDVSGWYLSDNASTPMKYRIAAGTRINAGAYLVFDESDFNPPLPNSTSLQPFALSGSRGDSVWLFAGDGTKVIGYSDHVSFDATYNGVSLGRLRDSNDRLVPLANRSLGSLNGMFQRSDVVITELNYHPDAPTPAAHLIDPTLSEKDLEFIEIVNVTAAPIDLTNWRLRGESDFDFAPSEQLIAGETLVVVSFDPTGPLNQNRADAFRTHYGIQPGVRLIGPFTGTLSNSHGVVKLQAPDTPPQDEPTLIPRVTVDEVFYDDLEPWPIEADGSGKSLQRIAATTLGSYAGSWRGESPTPGNVPLRATVESIQINDGTAQRSSVTSLQVRFDREVSLSSPAFVLTHRAKQMEVSDLIVSTEIVEGRTVASITFGHGPLTISGSSGNSLVDGHYQLTVVANGIKTAGTDATMATDEHFGTADSDAFFRYFGDSDGDRDVDGQDYARFASTYLRSSDHPEFDPSLDGDRDGDVDGIDLARFLKHFLKSIS